MAQGQVVCNEIGLAGNMLNVHGELRSLGCSWQLKNQSDCKAPPTHCSYTVATA